MTPDVRGSPVAFVNVITLGVPKLGVVKVGDASGAFKANASNTAFCDGAILVVPSLIALATLVLLSLNKCCGSNLSVTGG